MARIATEIRKDMLINAAVTVISRHGVTGATTRRICEEAGASLATLHYCFTHKEDLFLAVFDRLGVQAADASRAENAHDLGAALEQVLRDSLRWMVANEDYSRAVIDLYLWLLRQNPEGAARTYDDFVGAITVNLIALFPAESPRLIRDMCWLVALALDGLILPWFSSRDTERTLRHCDMQAHALRLLVDVTRADVLGVESES